MKPSSNRLTIFFCRSLTTIDSCLCRRQGTLSKPIETTKEYQATHPRKPRRRRARRRKGDSIKN